MKKRFLLAIIVGLSFAPPVFADLKFGEQTMKEQMTRNPQSVRCGEFQKKRLPADASGPAAPAKASSVGHLASR